MRIIESSFIITSINFFDNIWEFLYLVTFLLLFFEISNMSRMLSPSVNKYRQAFFFFSFFKLGTFYCLAFTDTWWPLCYVGKESQSGLYLSDTSMVSSDCTVYLALRESWVSRSSCRSSLEPLAMNIQPPSLVCSDRFHFAKDFHD